MDRVSSVCDVKNVHWDRQSEGALCLHVLLIVNRMQADGADPIRAFCFIVLLFLFGI